MDVAFQLHIPTDLLDRGVGADIKTDPAEARSVGSIGVRSAYPRGDCGLVRAVAWFWVTVASS